MFDWLIKDLFPNFIQNVSILATLSGTVLTICVWKKTDKLYKIYNKKIPIFYIIDRVKVLYISYSNEIRNVKKEEFKEDKKQIFWEIIKETNGSVTTYKITENDMIGEDLNNFKKNTKNLVSIPKDSLTYEDIWSYYNYLTELHHSLVNIKEMDLRKVSS